MATISMLLPKFCTAERNMLRPMTTETVDTDLDCHVHEFLMAPAGQRVEEASILAVPVL